MSTQPEPIQKPGHIHPQYSQIRAAVQIYLTLNPDVAPDVREYLSAKYPAPPSGLWSLKVGPAFVLDAIADFEPWIDRRYSKGNRVQRWVLTEQQCAFWFTSDRFRTYLRFWASRVPVQLVELCGFDAVTLKQFRIAVLDGDKKTVRRMNMEQARAAAERDAAKGEPLWRRWDNLTPEQKQAVRERLA